VVPAALAALLLLTPNCGGDDEGTDETDAREEAQVQPDTEEKCAPDCDGKDCGDDGCGGSCGKCFTLEGAMDDSLCSPGGTCAVCGCGDRHCGLDDCGSPCGTCPMHFACNEGFECILERANCQVQGFAAAGQKAKLKQAESGFTFRFEAVAPAGDGQNKLVVEIDSAAFAEAPDGPGVYDVETDNFTEGGLWVYLVPAEAAEMSKLRYIPLGGTITIESLSEAGGQFSATLNEVMLVEAFLEGETMAPIYKQNGQAWCLDGIKLAAEIAVTPLVCNQAASGRDMHDYIANFQLQRCDGEWVDLYEACNNYKAIWIVASSGW